MADKLIRVSNLKLTFIVDNCIEWFTKMPPGFSSELARHLSDNPPLCERTGVPFVDLENYCCGAHGFSVLIETQAGNETHSVLFDTGPDSKSIIRNLQSMRIPILNIERIILSHWHSDHSGGLLSFLKYRNEVGSTHSVSSSSQTKASSKVVVDLHPDRPIARGIRPLNVGKVIGRLPEDPSFSAIEAAGAVVETHAEGHVVAGGTVYVSGEIPRVTYFEQGLLGAVRWVEGPGGAEWTPEPDIMDERYAAIDVLGKGLVIFSACSHAGIVNVMRDAVTVFKRPVHMIIGGLHLGGPELQPRIAPTVNFLSDKIKPSPTYVLPMHCTGFNAKVALEEALGEGCVPAGVGITVNIEGDLKDDDRLFPPTIDD
ncbi:hypothetical protein SCHPADRAFT_819894 [Schizopora paradoxa]|uniref:Metallo-beta-lactamase domain-containing protein n=1 Tax=Schizopora paradoxa TaxID=27342 RepID=A0A0H2S360_9AGAM|nr:hypothetical protein SCHPADRAFT_819894 [Schizopora paradoxa]